VRSKVISKGSEHYRKVRLILKIARVPERCQVNAEWNEVTVRSKVTSSRCESNKQKKV
jgi:hypothetical protein